MFERSFKSARVTGSNKDPKDTGKISQRIMNSALIVLPLLTLVLFLITPKNALAATATKNTDITASHIPSIKPKVTQTDSCKTVLNTANLEIPTKTTTDTPTTINSKIVHLFLPKDTRFNFTSRKSSESSKSSKSSSEPQRKVHHSIRHSARIIQFNDNDQISVVLSRVDTNRIEVEDDKINAVNGPTGGYTAKNDASGAVYISVYQQLPFTLFLTTENGHSLSLFVVPKDMVGTTLIFNPLSTSVKDIEKEQSTPYQKLITTLIAGMVNHQAPDGYSYSDIARGKHFDFYGIADMALVGQYNGAKLNGLVFSLKNTTHHAITIKESWFYQQNVAAVALSKQTLLSGERGLVFDIVNKMSRA